MTLKAIHIGGTYHNLAEADRSSIYSMAKGTAGVIFEAANTTLANATELKVTAAATHAVNIGAGKAVIREKTAPTTRGSYYVHSDATETVSLPVPQAQPFFATIVLRVTDPQYGTVSGTVGLRIDVISGTAASSPVAVSDATIDGVTQTPGGWLRLADVRINTTDSGAIPAAQITDTRRAGGFGLIAAFSNARPAVAAVGAQIFEQDTGAQAHWDGALWVGEPGTLGVDVNQQAQGGSTISDLSWYTMLTLNFTMPLRGKYSAWAKGHFRPTGNAAGTMIVKVDGVQIASDSWHSQGSTSHQTGAIWESKWINAGAHTLTIECSIGSGSSPTVFDYFSAQVTA